jgi:hypothetical protein
MVVRSGVRSPTKNSLKWDKHPIETLHAEFSQNILHVQRKTPKQCRAELGLPPLIIKNARKELLNSITTEMEEMSTHSTAKPSPTER